MSTIHDALKKVQDDMGPQAGNSTPQSENLSMPHNPFNAAPPLAPQEPEQEAPESPKKNNAQKIIGAIFIIIILCGLGTSVFLLTNPNNLKNISFKSLKEASFQKNVQKVQAPSMAPSSKINFKGTMAVNNKHVALINNEIYEVGDSINNQRITSITKMTITIADEEGVLKTLNVSK